MWLLSVNNMALKRMLSWPTSEAHNSRLWHQEFGNFDMHIFKMVFTLFSSLNIRTLTFPVLLSFAQQILLRSDPPSQLLLWSFLSRNITHDQIRQPCIDDNFFLGEKAFCRQRLILHREICYLKMLMITRWKHFWRLDAWAPLWKFTKYYASHAKHIFEADCWNLSN